MALDPTIGDPYQTEISIELNEKYSNTVNGNNNNSKKRVDWVDWYRIILNHLVVFGHWFRFFDRHFDVIKLHNGEVAPHIEVMMMIGHAFLMLSFFFVSGVSLTLMSKSKKSYFKLFSSRFIRLSVPLIGGFLLMVIPSKYLQRNMEVQCPAAPYAAPDNVFGYYFFYFRYCMVSQGLNWLWFLPMLFLDTALYFPLVYRSMKNLHEERNLGKTFILFISYLLAFSLVYLFIHTPYTVLIADFILFSVLCWLSYFYQYLNKYVVGIIALLSSFMPHIILNMKLCSPPNEMNLCNLIRVAAGFNDAMMAGAIFWMYKDEIFDLWDVIKRFVIPVMPIVLMLSGGLILPMQSGEPNNYDLTIGIYATYTENQTWRINYSCFGITLVIFLFLIMQKGVPGFYYNILGDYLQRTGVGVYIVHPMCQVTMAVILKKFNLTFTQNFVWMGVASFGFTHLLLFLVQFVPGLRYCLGVMGPGELEVKQSLKIEEKSKEPHFATEI
eukprot:TRINITY_DN2324_c0_g1_i1.p1 TRINITY_DN2324_c0_g1~~TRINITY_DN2324_c0_g1_i1.p1  ORF type:complete len:497 (-),score=81.46 TRINITY_DN2324_c0_g1_i1:105-1595(-)